MKLKKNMSLENEKKKKEVNSGLNGLSPSSHLS
jgi:hypothetical protein